MQFVERFAAALVDAGMPRMAALVFVALLTSDSGRMTADELVTQLQVSRAGVSGAVRYLNHVGALSRSRAPGSRREHYALEDGTWYELVARREQLLERWVTAARAGVDALGVATPAGARLAESLAFFEFLQAEMPAMLARWKAQRASAMPSANHATASHDRVGQGKRASRGAA
jgi:predicted transcriptional regulator